jgi:hypothetical protein
MSKLTKKQFADHAGLTTGNLSNYIGRGKVVVGADDLIDTLHDVNTAFLQKRAKHLQNITIEPAPAAPTKQLTIEKQPGDDVAEEDIPELYISEKRLKHLQGNKTEEEIRLKKLEYEKKQGLVLPSELIKPVFLQHNQSMITAFKNATEQMITEFTQVKEFTTEETSYLRGQMIGAINKAAEAGTLTTEKALKRIINEFIDKKGVGERNS